MRLTLPAVVLAAACGTPVAAPAAAGEAPDRPPGVEKDLWRRLKRVDRRAAAIETLVAKFRQKKHTPLLEEPVVSRGRVRMKGDRLRWDTHTPRPTRMLLADGELRIYYPKQSLLEIYPADRRFSGVLATPVPRLHRLLETFRMEAERVEDAAAIRLRLTPRKEKVRKHVESVTLRLDPRRACVTRVRMRTPDGERTVIDLRKIRVGADIDDDALGLDVPEDTRVTRPYRTSTD